MMSTSTWNESAADRLKIDVKPTTLVWRALRILGSLKITVTMFALGMVILLVGTLAQDEETLVDVKNGYFNSWVAYTPLDVFLPVTIFPDHSRLPFVIPLPGGALIGLILLINLIAAKLTRFSMQARGGKLVAGLFFCSLGGILIGLILVGAHRGDGLQGEPPFSYDFLWLLCKSSVWLLTAATLTWVLGWPAKTTLVRTLSWILFAVLFGVSLFLIVTQDHFRIPDPGLRITWQLTKSLLVGVVLLIGLLLLFGKRGGNVLIHLGVGLMMLGQFIFGDQQVEERITLFEGQSTRVAYQLDTVELTFIQSLSDQEDQVIGVDSPSLESSARNKTYITDKALPVDILVKTWMPNHELQRVGKENDATIGSGLQYGALSQRKFSAAESEKVNLAAAYVTFREKEGGKEIGTYLLSQFLHDPNVTRKLVPETLKVGDQEYQLQFRFRNSVKPYQITLDDVKRENYSGSMTPRDFSSDVRVIGDDGTSEQNGHIWMNNPMRFRGESFYQSSYGAAEPGVGKESTTLQVVTNAGWLIPYVSCVICGLGMMVHFGDTFARFAGRYDRTKVKRLSRNGIILAIASTAVTAALFGYKMKPPNYDRDAFRWYEAGKLPVLHEGRIKPLDTVARNLLVAVSNRSKVYDPNSEPTPFMKMMGFKKSIGATQWFLSVIADADWTEDVDVIRIDSKEVLDTLGLTRREGNRYSFKEVAEKIPEVRAQLQKLDPENRDKWTFEQTKLAELSSRFGILEVLKFAYRPLVPNIPSELKEGAAEKFWQEKNEIGMLVKAIEKESPPGIIPPFEAKDENATGPMAQKPTTKWQAYGPAYFHAFEATLDGNQVDRRSLNKFTDVLFAVRDNKAIDFNSAVREFKSIVNETAPPSRQLSKAPLEAWYNHFDPITLCNMMYIMAAVIGLFGFVIWFEQLRSIGFWICFVTFLLHTVAIGLRVYLSDRPPVVNLYSSAVFIGWAVVLFGLAVEKLFPMGIGLLTGSVFGFLSLLVAYGLDTSDTMPVLQAVLDTQFWLATHVICITLGYSATFFAGAVGIVFLLYRTLCNLGFIKNLSAQSDMEKIIDRICYGIVCFALFFSFIGTVLGGLWGDDSWGRFWGWDPKENGALMIVLWNALLIHARWDKIVRGRGFALFAVAGNIVTAWSWFGTNQLGIGLHSYGFNKHVLYWLAGFVISQLLILLIGSIATARADQQPA